MFSELAEKNWACSTELFNLEFCRHIAQDCRTLHEQGAFQKASVGRGATKAIHTEIRGDYTLWLDSNDASPLQNSFLNHLGTILNELNRSFYLGLKRFESHFAVYPPGAGYDKHVDNHRGTGARKITFILYLNENWQKGDGGELSLYSPDQPSHLLAQVEPRLGTFILFRSDLFPHQVEKSVQPRLSITGWFRNDLI